MSTLIQPPPGFSMAPPLWMRRFTVAEYLRLLDTGFFCEGEPIELWEGWLVYKMPHNPPHAASVRRTAKRVDRLLPNGWCSQAQLPILLSDSAPEPDVAVLRGEEAEFDVRLPESRDVAMLIEVSDSTLARDRTVMARMYARASIPIVWIANIPDGQVEVYTDPTGDCDEPTYRNRRDYPRGEDVPLVLDGVEVGRIPVAELLP